MATKPKKSTEKSNKEHYTIDVAKGVGMQSLNQVLTTLKALEEGGYDILQPNGKKLADLASKSIKVQDYNTYPEPDISGMLEGMTQGEIKELEYLTGKSLQKQEPIEEPLAEMFDNLPLYSLASFSIGKGKMISCEQSESHTYISCSHDMSITMLLSHCNEKGYLSETQVMAIPLLHMKALLKDETLVLTKWGSELYISKHTSIIAKGDKYPEPIKEGMAVPKINSSVSGSVKSQPEYYYISPEETMTVEQLMLIAVKLGEIPKKYYSYTLYDFLEQKIHPHETLKIKKQTAPGEKTQAEILSSKEVAASILQGSPVSVGKPKEQQKHLCDNPACTWHGKMVGKHVNIVLPSSTAVNVTGVGPTGLIKTEHVEIKGKTFNFCDTCLEVCKMLGVPC